MQVRATNDEGTSAWSRVVTVKTNKDGTNQPPASSPQILHVCWNVDENTPSGRDVGPCDVRRTTTDSNLADLQPRRP